VIAALPRLHAVTDDRVARIEGLPRLVAAMAAEAGAALAVHLRTRTLPAGTLLALARELGAALAPHGAWLVVNDRADVARVALARAVVSGRTGLGVADVRRVAPSALVGRSVHDAAEIRAAAAEGSDFLVAGSVFATASHPQGPVAGLDVVRAAAATGRPVLAIGGLTPARASDAVLAGAWGVAAIRALWDAADPAAAVRDFLAALPRDGTIALVVNGEARQARRGLTLAQLLDDLALDPRAVVVEHNRRIVRRDALAATPVDEGDAIELVHFVGGG
jgi:thiamine-phosphate pyrophosphorylase